MPRGTVRCTEQEAQANLLVELQLCGAGKLRCSQKTHRPGAATVAAVAEILRDGDFYPADPIAAFAWPLLLQAGGLAELASGKLSLTARGRAALTKPPHATLRLLWQRRLNRAVLDEFSRIEEIKGQRAAAVLSPAGPAARRSARPSPPAQRGSGPRWTTCSRPCAIAGSTSPSRAATAPCGSCTCKTRQYGSLGYDGVHDWSLPQGRYTLAVLFEYAATLGLIDIEYVPPVGAREDYRDNWGGDDLDQLSRYDGLLALCLNPLGAYATGRTPAYMPAPAPVDTDCRGIKVLPNFDIVALDGLRLRRVRIVIRLAARKGRPHWQTACGGPTMTSARLSDRPKASPAVKRQSHWSAGEGPTGGQPVDRRLWTVHHGVVRANLLHVL